MSAALSVGGLCLCPEKSILASMLVIPDFRFNEKVTNSLCYWLVCLWYTFVRIKVKTACCVLVVVVRAKHVTVQCY